MNGRAPAIIGIAATPVVATAAIRIDIFADGEVEFVRNEGADHWAIRTRGHVVTITCNEVTGTRTDGSTAELLRRIATIMTARPGN